MKDVLKRIISEFHQRPWPPFKPRHINVPEGINKIFAIIGPRRAGKTWYLFQLMCDLEQKGMPRHQMLYLNFEDERLELEGNYDVILESWQELYPNDDLSNVWFFFDEIQELPNWEKFIRRLYDTCSQHIYLTGSNARLLSTDIATSLRGRSLSIEILPLSFKEFLEFKDIDLTDRHTTRKTSLIQIAFEEYRLWGGYPELVTMESHIKIQVLQEYFNVMIFRDLVERYGVKDVSLLKYIIKRLIGSFTKEYSVNKLYNELKSGGWSISKDYLYQMTEQIFSIYLMTSVEKYNPSVIKREMSNKKVYLYDNGLVSASSYQSMEDRGKLLENMVCTQLHRLTKDIVFIKNGGECDFVALSGNHPPLLIQVTDHLSRDNLTRELKGLSIAQKHFPQGQSLLLYNTCVSHLSLPENITTQPVLC